MNLPVITENISGYAFAWGDYGIVVHVNRLQTHKSDGRVTGELYVEAMNQTGIVTIYPPTSYNFSAIRTRAELANSLTRKNPKLPWRDMVDQLCYGVQDKAKKGDPVIELSSGDEAVPPEYIIEPLIVKNYPNILFGDPSSAKSTLAVLLSQVALLPWSDNPMGLTAPKESTRVLYLDWETDAATIRYQATQIQRGIDDMPALFLHYRRCSLPLAQDIEQIRQHIGETKAELIIIDSLGLAAGGELKETQSALSFYSALRMLKTTSLILAHNSKDRETKTRSIFGSQYFTAQARNVWEVRKSQEPGSSELSIALFHRKPPPFAGLHSPVGFKFQFTATALTISPSDPKNVAEFISELGLKAQILEALTNGAMTAQQLAETIDRPLSQIRVRCSELHKQGKITKLGKEWGLPYECAP